MNRLFDSPVHLLILVLVIVVVFGWKRLPDASRSLGRSLRIFKSEVEDMKGDKPARSAASSDTVRGDVVTPEQPQAPTAAPTPPPAGTATSSPSERAAEQVPAPRPHEPGTPAGSPQHPAGSPQHPGA